MWVELSEDLSLASTDSFEQIYAVLVILPMPLYLLYWILIDLSALILLAWPMLAVEMLFNDILSG